MKEYEGNEAYIFVSYCRQDSTLCEQLLDGLSQANIRFWYDHQIDPGDTWPEIIGDHLARCHVCVALITREFTESFNCNKELAFAAENHIPVIPVLVDDVSMSCGMQLSIAGSQRIKIQKSAPDAFKEVLAAPLVAECCDEEPSLRVPESQQEQPEDPFRLLCIYPRDGSFILKEIPMTDFGSFADGAVIPDEEGKTLAEITAEDHQIFLHNRRERPLLADGKLLSPGDKTQIQDAVILKKPDREILICLNGEAETVLQHGMVGKLISQKTREDRYLLGQPLTLGRDYCWDKGTMEDDLLNRRHCEIIWEDGYAVQDLQTQNGTLLNGKLIRFGETVRMADGDLLQLGRTLLIFQEIRLKQKA